MYFQPNASPTVDSSSGRVWEHITMTVHFPDHSQQSIDLDYPFYYPSRAVDPYFPENNSVPATFQFPPTARRNSEPPLVEYVIQHTGVDGYTTLRSC